MTPAHKRLLLIAVPVIIVLVVVVVIKARSDKSAQTSTVATTPVAPPASDEGQLADFENTITDQLNQLEGSLGDGQAPVAWTPGGAANAGAGLNPVGPVTPTGVVWTPVTPTGTPVVSPVGVGEQ